MNPGASPEQERPVIELRYGVDGGAAPVCLSEAGRRLGSSAERIRKLESWALEWLALERELAAPTEEAA
jgi:DNA-directed RNA polymerase sigma subunit (sigma70/sigma32)